MGILCRRLEQNGSGKTYVTPFTEAGLIDAPPVAPEPASLLLLGKGLLASGGSVVAPARLGISKCSFPKAGTHPT